MEQLTNENIYINKDLITTAVKTETKDVSGNTITLYVITFAGGQKLNVTEADFDSIVGKE